MTIKVHGLRSAQAELNKAMREVNDATEEMLTVILMGISANTAPYVPVDSSALINSETRKVQKGKKGPTGYIEYGGHGTNARGTPVQEYARYVHEGPQKNWQKPGASNLFLARGTRDFIRDDLSNIIAAYQT